MYLDERLEFADAVSVAAAAGTAILGDVIDLETARDIGQGEPLYLVITTDTEVITGGAAGTIKFQLVSDAQAALATNGTATVHYDTGTFVTDGTDANALELKAGGVIAVVALPWEGQPYERYLGVLRTIATTTITAGAVNAFLTHDPAVWKAHPDATN